MLTDPSDEMRETYGFGLPATPSYRTAQIGAWRIASRPEMASNDGTYLSHHAIEPAHHVLYQGDETWMATSLLERQSHAWHVAEARGLVVVAGLGLGMYALQAAAKPEVDLVIVGEISPEVIDLFSGCVETAPENLEKIRIVKADVRSPSFADRVQDLIGDRRPDYLYADIWPDYPNPEGPALTAGLNRTLRPAAAGWWGQELAFGLWCEEKGRACDRTSLVSFFADAGVPVEPTAGYLHFCRDAIETAGLDLEPSPSP